MTELQKLDEYLKGKMIPHSTVDSVTVYYDVLGEKEYKIERHQIIVMDKNGNKKWDAICHKGSYGYENGLLEVMGDAVVKDSDGDSVVGWLTAQDVIDRLEGIS